MASQSQLPSNEHEIKKTLNLEGAGKNKKPLNASSKNYEFYSNQPHEKGHRGKHNQHQQNQQYDNQYQHQ